MAMRQRPLNLQCLFRSPDRDAAGEQHAQTFDYVRRQFAKIGNGAFLNALAFAITLAQQHC